jgi:TonB family protein
MAAAEAEALQKRLERARALAAAHQLSGAAMELESIRASAKDEMYRNVSSLMLMGIYLEDGNYVRAESMLEETFKLRSSKKESSVRTYFALAGQAVNGARAHVGRYRSFGINVSNPALPVEATTDLERLRSLLERMTAQARELVQQNGRDNDAFALLEDIAGIRANIARDNEDRARWQNEYSAARAKLATLPAEAVANNQSFPTRGNSDVAANRTSAPEIVSELTSARETAEGTPKTALPNVAPGPVGGNSATVVPAPAAALLEVGSLYEKATKKVEPAYPQIAKNSGVSGLVRVKLVIDESGSVSNIVWTEGPLVLRQAAQDAVRQWKFQPVVIDGKPVRASGYIDFGFSR